MKEKIFKGIRVGSSDPNRLKELKKAHEEFLKLQQEGWKIETAKVTKRPRIKQEPTPKRIKVQAGFITITVEYADWVANGSIGRIIEKY